MRSAAKHSAAPAIRKRSAVPASCRGRGGQPRRLLVLGDELLQHIDLGACHLCHLHVVLVQLKRRRDLDAELDAQALVVLVAVQLGEALRAGSRASSVGTLWSGSELGF